MITEREIALLLTYNDKLVKSDAIVILEGDSFYRVKHACKLFKENYAKYLVFSGGIENQAYGSLTFEKLENRFIEEGVKPNSIIVEGKSQNTREQAENIIELCLINNWKKIILVASHYHQFRAFLTFLKVLNEKKLEKTLIISNSHDSQLDWYEKLPYGIRFELLESEFNRIEKYNELGHIATIEDALSYFKWKATN